jgi:hypothetical protein
VYNNSDKVKKNLMAQFSEGLDSVLKAGFGTIRVIIDEERGVYDVIASPRIRVK